MAISIFPSTAAEFVSNNFVVDMNDTSNNTADTGGVKQAGPYSISLSSGDSSFDVYLIDSDGNSVGYSNNTSIVASGLFTTVVILGVAQDEVVSFLYQGSVNNADGEGDEPGAGAYLESISPSDLPNIDDTATVIGGNFGADTEITFESGATVLPAKSITVVSGTELLVTRPDGLIEDNAPYDLKAINTGVTPPSSVDFVLTDAVTAGSDPTWVTTSPLNAAPINQAFSQTLEATDADGTVVDYSVTAGTITTGLSLDSSTGVLSGTPTTAGNFTFTVTATDDGGNETAKQFEQTVQVASGGTVTNDGNVFYHTFTSSDDFVAFSEIANLEYLVVAGGGGGGGQDFGSYSISPGGGGAGGLLNGTQTVSAGTQTVVVGAGGTAGVSSGQAGSNSSFGSIATAIGGGAGNMPFVSQTINGGSGGGGWYRLSSGVEGFNDGGTGTVGQGFAGGNPTQNRGGGGGGAGEAGSTDGFGQGGDGLQFADFAVNSGLNYDGGYFAGGGAAPDLFNDSLRPASLGGGGVNANGVSNATTPAANSGSGGGAGYIEHTGAGGGGRNVFNLPSAGADGVVIVRYSI